MGELTEAKALASQFEKDMLLENAANVYDDAAMKKTLPKDVYQRFQANLMAGTPTTEADKQTLADAVFKWARERGATSFAHWFFPVRSGGGAVGGQLGALKCDAFLDLDWSSTAMIKPSKATFPADRLFAGESDGSSFPNGGLRATHRAAAFTAWDRASPCFVYDNVLRIPCCFITHTGKCIDEKTPLLRSVDAVDAHGQRLLKCMNVPTKKGETVQSFLGWEQEFFVVSAELYKKRPDLVNCGRTLFGKLPPKSQQASLNYFAPVPAVVERLLINVQAIMVKLGSAMTVRHNEVAPGQHEMSPIFCAANASSDSNVLFMEVCAAEAKKLGLVVLFHEKPFAGINGSGKHNNWSVGTSGGRNFFHPGKTDESKTLFVAAVACLAYGLAHYNELVRCAVATAGNDHRLGGQEAPPAIVSLYPGPGFEKHVDDIVKGGGLLAGDYFTKNCHTAPTHTKFAQAVDNAAPEDRNRTAPFPWCGNRFEFRAVGSAQNCAFPIAVCNVVMAAGMDYLSGLLEGGTSLRDAVAMTYKASRHVIFTGNGYAKEWPEEATKQRGLPNLATTPMALAAFDSGKNKDLLKKLNVFAEEETTARKACLVDNYNTVLEIEVSTFLKVVKTGFLPACAKDLALYATAGVDDAKKTLYGNLKTELAALEYLTTKVPENNDQDKAFFLCDTVKPQMLKLRALVDQVEDQLDAQLYPFPTYQDLLYSHHF